MEIEKIFVIIKRERNTEWFDNVWGVGAISEHGGEEGLRDLLDSLNDDEAHNDRSEYIAVMGYDFECNN